MVGRMVTIGVYGFTVERFLQALRRARVDVLLDVRQRRGVRGSEYAWANARRLQQELGEQRIDYRHLKELSPTTEMRVAQYSADAASGKRQRTRTELGGAFRRAYLERVLDHANLEELLGEFDDSITGALLCVERDPSACHRGLIADRLSRDYGVPVEHLLPVERLLP